MVNEMGREPTPEELAQRTGRAGQEGAADSRVVAQAAVAGDTIGEDSELGDFLEDKSAGSPNDTLLGQDLTTQVERALATLSPKEKEILRLRFASGKRASTRLERGRQALRRHARAHSADRGQGAPQAAASAARAATSKRSVEN